MFIIFLFQIKNKMAKSLIKTRHSTKSVMSEFLGSAGVDFTTSELPALRSVLLKGVLLKENFVMEDGGGGSEGGKQYEIGILARDIMISLLNQWSKANAQFKPPIIISEKAICDKIVRAWTTASKIALKKITKKVDVERFSSRLDKLFDLCRCQCPILTCTDIKYEGCSTNIHIQCQ